MINKLAVDANAVIDLIRHDRVDPPPLDDAEIIYLPVPVVGELFAGAHGSRDIRVNVAAVEEVLARWTVIAPDLETARRYGRLRGELRFAETRPAKINDLWIAALCLQHDLPLLTNDRGFDAIPNLAVVHW
jgi:tRNA(fMet)-specific endonuclease VapC